MARSDCDLPVVARLERRLIDGPKELGVNLAVVKLGQIVDFLRRNGRRLRLGPLAVLPPRPVEDVQDDAASSLGLGNIEGVEELALDETPVDGRPLVRLQSLVEIGEKALPGRPAPSGAVTERLGRFRLPVRLTSGSRNASRGSPFPARRSRSSASMTAAQMCLQISAAIREVGAVTRRAKRIAGRD